jgi:hypothetical protein
MSKFWDVISSMFSHFVLFCMTFTFTNRRELWKTLFRLNRLSRSEMNSYVKFQHFDTWIFLLQVNNVQVSCFLSSFACFCFDFCVNSFENKFKSVVSFIPDKVEMNSKFLVLFQCELRIYLSIFLSFFTS